MCDSDHNQCSTTGSDDIQDLLNIKFNVRFFNEGFL